MAENSNSKPNLSLSEQEDLKRKIELQEMKRAESEKMACNVYPHNPSEDDRKREIDRKRINIIKNLYGF